MRVDPAEEIVKQKELAEQRKIAIQNATRIVALVVAFISTFFFFFKILFF